jgi:hypothetical protein
MTSRPVRRGIAALAITLAGAFLATGAFAVGAGQTCGGIAGVSCDAGLWCESRAAMCGVADVQGTCVRVPDVCPAVVQQVCGCGKRTFGNDCERRRAKVAKDSDGPCQ